jgi:serine/threonine protein kinase
MPGIAPQASPTSFDLPAGTMLGKYEIISKLAMGGMAEIYLARISGTAGFEKVVVLKRILPTVASDPKFVQMFLDEARLAATLSHPNIADVYEVGDHGGAPFFAMEFVHGQDARSLRAAAAKKREQVPLAIALAIVHATATALDYAHSKTGPDGKVLGLVHRDVSTSNILIGYEGAIKLIDFGIARATSSNHQTKTGTLKGKIPYMSPEQCRGMHVDHRSDLFSLGVVLYELTSGRRPFRGDTDFAIMDQIVYGGAKPPSVEIEGYPPELEKIVMRLLSRHADDRYQSAEEMLHDLDPFISEHRLFVSPKQMSRYMRSLFADKMAAWDRGFEGGMTAIQHLTSTGATADSQILTPPAAFPAIASLSEEMAAQRPPSVTPFPSRPSGTLDALADPSTGSLVAPIPQPAAPPELLDYNLKPRRFGIIIGTAMVLVMLGGGAFAAWHFVGKKDKPAATAPSEPTVAKPEPPKPEPAKPEPTKVEPAVAPEPVTKPEPEPEKPETPEPVAQKPVTVKRPPPTRPVVVKPTPKPDPVKKPDPVVKKPEPDPKEPKKEPKWTPSDGSAADSPFLPQ